MAKKVGEYPIPFDKEGNQLSYAYSWIDGKVEWRNNYEFDATLTYSDYARGRSAVGILLCDEHGHQYSMFLSMLDELFISRGFEGRSVTGRWTFVKRGENYSIRLVG